MADSQGSFNDLKKAFEAYQMALRDFSKVQQDFNDNKLALGTNYGGSADSSASIYMKKMNDWDGQFTLVKAALARMTLELSNSTEDYQKNENTGQEIANAINATLVG